MKILKKLIPILMLLLFISNSFSQADCKITYKYEGIIKSKSATIISIDIPTSRNLLKRDSLFYPSKVQNNKINQLMLSHLSGVFCGEKDKIINRVLKKEHRFRIYISGKNQPLEIIIPVEDIEFRLEYNQEWDNHIIIINIGEINI